VLFSILFLKPTFSQAKDNTLSPPEITGIYFTETGCSHCDSFLYVQKAKLEHDYGVSIVLETHDILSAAGYEQCVKMLKQKQLNFTVFPVLFIGSNIYRGSSAIERICLRKSSIIWHTVHTDQRCIGRTSSQVMPINQTRPLWLPSFHHIGWPPGWHQPLCIFHNALFPFFYSA
jgi:glutaredoxin